MRSDEEHVLCLLFWSLRGVGRGEIGGDYELVRVSICVHTHTYLDTYNLSHDLLGLVRHTHSPGSPGQLFCIKCLLYTQHNIGGVRYFASGKQ